MINDAEYYFIQLLFCRNRDLLRKKHRGIYDAMFNCYEDIFKKGNKIGADVADIEKKFMRMFKKC